MTLAEGDAAAAPESIVRALAADEHDGAAVIETTELRWFATGSIPPDVETWFTRSGTVGAIEERCDRYRLDDQVALGVKRRFRTTLELKLRQSVGERLALDGGLAGCLEVWRKWSPVDGFTESSAPWPWLDVSKRVVKRRFSVGGNEIEHSSDVDTMDVAGCDVEIVSVEADETRVWSFAFAAFGPSSTRRDALVAAWRAVRAGELGAEALASHFELSCGYPEWLAGLAAGR